MMYAATVSGTTSARFPRAVYHDQQPERGDELAEHLRAADAGVRRELKKRQRKHRVRNQHAGECADALGENVHGHRAPRESAFSRQRDAHRGIEVRAGDRAEREDQRHEDGAGGETVREQGHRGVAACQTLAHDSRPDNRRDQHQAADRFCYERAHYRAQHADVLQASASDFSSGRLSCSTTKASHSLPSGSATQVLFWFA